MPKLSPHSLPSYCRHRASGQAVVTLNGKDIYLGTYNSAASRAEYNRIIAEWLANGRRLPSTDDVAVVDLIERFWEHCRKYYVRADGTASNEQGTMAYALKPVKRLYGRTSVADFGPLKLKAVRDEMIRLGWCRTNVNKQIQRVKLMFKWGVEHELVPPGVYHGLQAVAGLRAGRSEARESKPVRPVPQSHVDAIKGHVSGQVWAMIELQTVTGMRPGEVCSMRGIDLDTTGKLWCYRPPQHKTAHRGHARVIYLGQRCQEIIRPFLKTDLSAFLFSPAEAEAERRQKMHQKRVDEKTTPLSCGNVPGSNRKRKAKRAPGRRYSVGSYRKAIGKGCEKAWPCPADLVVADDDTPDARAKKAAGRLAWRADHAWHPHQLRHNAATRIRKAYGIEAARVVLGQRSVEVAEIYAEADLQAAERIASEVG